MKDRLVVYFSVNRATSTLLETRTTAEFLAGVIVPVFNAVDDKGQVYPNRYLNTLWRMFKVYNTVFHRRDGKRF